MSSSSQSSGSGSNAATANFINALLEATKDNKKKYDDKTADDTRKAELKSEIKHTQMKVETLKNPVLENSLKRSTTSTLLNKNSFLPELEEANTNLTLLQENNLMGKILNSYNSFSDLVSEKPNLSNHLEHQIENEPVNPHAFNPVAKNQTKRAQLNNTNEMEETHPELEEHLDKTPEFKRNTTNFGTEPLPQQKPSVLLEDNMGIGYQNNTQVAIGALIDAYVAMLKNSAKNGLQLTETNRVVTASNLHFLETGLVSQVKQINTSFEEGRTAAQMHTSAANFAFAQNLSGVGQVVTGLGMSTGHKEEAARTFCTPELEPYNEGLNGTLLNSNKKLEEAFEIKRDPNDPDPGFVGSKLTEAGAGNYHQQTTKMLVAYKDRDGGFFVHRKIGDMHDEALSGLMGEHIADDKGKPIVGTKARAKHVKDLMKKSVDARTLEQTTRSLEVFQGNTYATHLQDFKANGYKPTSGTVFVHEVHEVDANGVKTQKVVEKQITQFVIDKDNNVSKIGTVLKLNPATGALESENGLALGVTFKVDDKTAERLKQRGELDLYDHADDVLSLRAAGNKYSKLDEKFETTLQEINGIRNKSKDVIGVSDKVALKAEDLNTEQIEIHAREIETKITDLKPSDDKPSPDEKGEKALTQQEKQKLAVLEEYKSKLEQAKHLYFAKKNAKASNLPENTQKALTMLKERVEERTQGETYQKLGHLAKEKELMKPIMDKASSHSQKMEEVARRNGAKWNRRTHILGGTIQTGAALTAAQTQSLQAQGQIFQNTSQQASNLNQELQNQTQAITNAQNQGEQALEQGRQASVNQASQESQTFAQAINSAAR